MNLSEFALVGQTVFITLPLMFVVKRQNVHEKLCLDSECRELRTTYIPQVSDRLRGSIQESSRLIIPVLRGYELTDSFLYSIGFKGSLLAYYLRRQYNYNRWHLRKKYLHTEACRKSDEGGEHE